MDETTKINVEEHLGLALGHLHKAQEQIKPPPGPNADMFTALDIAVAYAKVKECLDSLRKEVPTA